VLLTVQLLALALLLAAVLLTPLAVAAVLTV
jgi:hypothetical protein